MLPDTAIADFTVEAEAHFKRAEKFERAGRMQEAAAAWVEGIELNPVPLRPHLRLAEALYQVGLFDLCATACHQALLLDPKNTDAHFRLGSVHEILGNRSGAIDSYTRSLENNPQSSDTRRRIAQLHRSEGDLGQARTLLEELVRRHPDNAGYRFELAGVLADTGARTDAIEELRKALKSRTRFPEALNNLALILRVEGRLEEAEQCFRRALAQNGRYAVGWNNLGNLHLECSSLDDAGRCYDRAISCTPDYAEAHTNRALLKLLKGQFTAGWEEYEWRWKQPGIGRPNFPKPAWDGTPLTGKTILLYSEQGAGDTIQFIRYARLIREQGGTVILHCQSALSALMRELPEIGKVVSGREPLPNFDFHAPLMSLPRLFGTSEANIPAAIPYLRVPGGVTAPEPLRRAQGFRVGLVWAGNPHHRNDRNRSIEPQGLVAALQQLDGVTVFSLQVGAISAPEGVVDLAPFLSDYAETAASIAALDLVITVDTSVAHLAGAMGRPVWVLLPACNDWRWLEKRGDSPWYPSMRLFRQHELGKWKLVIDLVQRELVQVLLERKQQ